MLLRKSILKFEALVLKFTYYPLTKESSILGRSLFAGVVFMSSILLFSSCVSDKVEPDKLYGGIDYFPFYKSDTINYKVIEINFTVSKSDTNTYFVREKMIDLIEKDNNKTAIIAQSYSKTLEETFKTTKLYSILLNNKELVYKIDDKSYLYSPLPVEKGISFDQNLYNSEAPKLASIDNLASNVMVNDFDSKLVFNNALQIVFEKKINAIEDIYKHMIYQSKKGLVFELNQSINRQPNQLPIGYKIIKIRL